MDYELLPKLFYKDRVKYMTEIHHRKSSPATTLLNFEIHSDQAFYMSVSELLMLQNNIYQTYMRFKKVFDALPEVAQDCYCRKCLVDEIVLTNDLEGVHSTRRDVLDVLQSEKIFDKSVRFAGLIKKYVLLTENIEHMSIPLSTLKDIRALYDDIVLPEIESEDIPDGTYFRKDSVSVLSMTEKVKHRGILGEENINEHMRQALTILNVRIHPPLVQIVMFLYIIGYIHPFYDGNGRLSRFISSYLLSKIFHPIVAYRLSYTIKQYKSSYYDAFDYVNDRNSYGDLTPFIIIFSELVHKSILSLEEKVNDVSSQMNYFWNMLQCISNDEIKTFIFYFVQNSLFSPDPFTIKELAGISSKSEPTIRRMIEKLYQSGIPIQISRRGHAKEYRIDLDLLPAALRNANL